MSESQTAYDDPIGQFIRRLDTLDAGGRARLKRNAGRALGEARDVYQVFFAALPWSVQHPREQEDYFLVATLWAFGTHLDDPQPRTPPASLGMSLGGVRRELLGHGERDGEGSTSLDRRFAALLDADREQLPFRLRQAVSLLRAHDIAIDWRQLLRDVRRWNVDGRPVQLQWARHYFVGVSTPSSTIIQQKKGNQP